MRPEKLIYTFVSYAYGTECQGEVTVPREGFERIAAVAHKHGIPVTWIVNSESARVLGDQIRNWHEVYGDDVIIRGPVNGEEVKGGKTEIKKFLEREWESVKEAFPWAETKVAARGKISNEVIEVMEELDFKGMWGYCWEQVWWDGITHKGIPWGFWYVDNDRYKVPHPAKGKIVACEWTARDLNQTYHTGSPCIYSTDPDDVLRAGLCTGENIEYWKKLFDDYLQNTESNEHVFFLQQQEAHEMDSSDGYAFWPLSQIQEDEKMLDHFFQYVKGHKVMLTTLPEAIELYHQKNRITPPTYMLTHDSTVRPEINEYTMTLGGVGLGPWPETFFYYDHECQMAFIKGECRPHTLRNYIGKWDMNDTFEEDVPQIFVTKFNKSENRIEITYELGYWKPVPFGLVYWDDLAGFEVKSCEGVSEAKIIQDSLVFIRFNLTGDKKKIELTLQKYN